MKEQALGEIIPDADAADAIAGGAERLVEGGEVEWIVLEIVLDAGAAIGPGGGEAGAGGGAERGVDDRLLETDAAPGEPLNVGHAHGHAGGGLHEIPAVLVGNEKEDVGSAVSADVEFRSGKKNP